MAQLTELRSDQHGDWKVAPNCAMEVAQSQHIINLKVTEVGKAISTFPVFATKMNDSGGWAISAIASLEINKNLYVKSGQWDATYLPAGLQTYPFFLMQSSDDTKKFTVGIEETNPFFSTQEGEPLFEGKKKASLLLSNVTAMLQDDLKNDVHTYQFFKIIEELGLLTPIDLVVNYVSGTTNSLKGLYTLDEARLQSLTIEELGQLRERGFLAPIFGMLMSIYQLNALIKRHNAVDGAERITQVKVETEKPASDR